MNDPVGKFVVSATAPARSKFTAKEICSPAAKVRVVGEAENSVEVNDDENDTGNELGLRKVTLIAVPVLPKSNLVVDICTPCTAIGARVVDVLVVDVLVDVELDDGAEREPSVVLGAPVVSGTSGTTGAAVVLEGGGPAAPPAPPSMPSSGVVVSTAGSSPVPSPKIVITLPLPDTICRSSLLVDESLDESLDVSLDVLMDVPVDADPVESSESAATSSAPPPISAAIVAVLAQRTA